MNKIKENKNKDNIINKNNFIENLFNTIKNGSLTKEKNDSLISKEDIINKANYKKEHSIKNNNVIIEKKNNFKKTLNDFKTNNINYSTKFGNINYKKGFGKNKIILDKDVFKDIQKLKENIGNIFKSRKNFSELLKNLEENKFSTIQKTEGNTTFDLLEKFFKEINLFHLIDRKNRIFLYHIGQDYNKNYFTYFLSLDDKIIHLPNIMKETKEGLVISSFFKTQIYNEFFLVSKSSFLIKKIVKE